MKFGRNRGLLRLRLSILSRLSAFKLNECQVFTPQELCTTTPNSHLFDVGVQLPSINGRRYGKLNVPLDKKGVLTSGSNCIHGGRKEWCSICRKIEDEKKRKEPTKLDIFLFILPILQPPLNYDFENFRILPEGMALYDFQRMGIKFLVDRDSALLADEMGLGKSIQTILALRILFKRGITNALVLCPKTVVPDWDRKFAEWAKELRVIKIEGGRQERKNLWSSRAHVYIASYETYREDLSFSRDYKRHFSPTENVYYIKCRNHWYENPIVKVPADQISNPILCPKCTISFQLAMDIAGSKYSVLVLDEIQKLKNRNVEISKTVDAVVASYRWGLSGTPLENRIEDLITVFRYLKSGLLSKYDANDLPGVRDKIRPYFLRRRKRDVLKELPEKVYETVWLDLGAEQRRIYEKAEREGILELKDGRNVTGIHVLSLIAKLKEVCNLDDLSGESAKLDYLIEYIEDHLADDEKALVFSQYPEVTLKKLMPRLQKYGAQLFHGQMNQMKREEVLGLFKKDPQKRVLLMSIKAGGIGLTITEANHVCHFDQWWNPAILSQAEDRAHRIGQRKTVFVRYLLTKDTIEERIAEKLEEKRKLFSEVVDDLSEIDLSQILTEDELFGLFGIKR